MFSFLRFLMHFAFVLIMSLGAFSCNSKKDKKVITPTPIYAPPTSSPPQQVSTEPQQTVNHTESIYKRRRGVQQWSQTRSHQNNTEPADANIDDGDDQYSASEEVKEVTVESAKNSQPVTSNKSLTKPYDRYNYAPQQQGPISSTGVADTKERPFIDSRFDTILPVLRGEVDRLTPQQKEDSIGFAMAIHAMIVQANVRTRNVRVEFIFDGAERKPIRAVFSGTLDNDNKALMYETSETSQDDYPFVVTLVCIDNNLNTCENTIVRIDQFAPNGNVCKTAYVVHRIGDVHVTFSLDDYQNSLRSENDNFNEFMTALKNTHDGVQKIVACRNSGRIDCSRPPMKTPSFNDVEFRSWAVAYGRAKFVVSMWSNVTQENPIQDALVFSSPLQASNERGQLGIPLSISGYQRDLRNPDIYTHITHHRSKFGSYIENSQLIQNDGDGNLSVLLSFRGKGDSATLNFHSQVLPARNYLHYLKNEMTMDPVPVR